MTALATERPALVVGEMYRVADHAGSRGDGSGYVDAFFFGKEVRVDRLPGIGYGRTGLDSAHVTLEGRGGQYIHPNFLTPVGEPVNNDDPAEATEPPRPDDVLRLQRMIHRVASYEAAKRDWCDEVNGSLEAMGLPEHLRTVDRILGQALKDNPGEVPNLDGPIQSARTPDNPYVGMDEDEEPGEAHYCLEIQVDQYEAEDGYTVSGLPSTVTVCVDVEWESEDDNPGDPSDFAWSDYVTNDQVREAIDNQGWPSVDRYSTPEWSESHDWTTE